jgi:hypothetical protein
MRTRRVSVCLFVLFVCLASATAEAQYQSRPYVGASDPATGERYNVEVAAGFWNPTPDIVFSSEQFGIPGTRISAVDDLGIQQARLRDFRLVLRPARKHKFRFSYTPITYQADDTLRRSVVFNGILYQAGLPVQTDFTWKSYRVGYEYDFIYRDRGFLGFILDAKVTDASIQLNSPLASEFVSARAPIPTVGLIGRGYILPNVAITGELTGFTIPESENRDYDGRYYDLDIYGTVNFTNNVGVQAGYRRLTVGFTVDDDFGDFKLSGLYLMGVVRF